MVWSNCFLCLMYLIIAGKVHAVCVLSPPPGHVMPHLVALNARGQALHFAHVLPDKQNPYAPWWFLGRIKGVSRLRQPAELSDSGRRVILVDNHTGLIFAVCAFLWLAAALPWLFAWFYFSIDFNLRGTLAALRRRRSHF